MAVEVIVKKWGNSLGIVLPREFVDKKKINENDEVLVEVVKRADLSDIFGIVKKRKLSGQEAKDLARKEWK